VPHGGRAESPTYAIGSKCIASPAAAWRAAHNAVGLERPNLLSDVALRRTTYHLREYVPPYRFVYEMSERRRISRKNSEFQIFLLQSSPRLD